MSVMSKMRTPRKRSLLTGFGHALRAAIDAAARLLDRHEQQVAVDRDVALAARADDRREQPRALRALNVVGVEAVEVAHEQVRAAEREIGVGEVESAGARRRGRVRRVGLRPGRPLAVSRRFAARWPAAVPAAWRSPARSPGIARPAGFFGSKKPSGRGRVETSSMPFAATPASRNPGFKPTRGSLASAGFCCATPVAIPSAANPAIAAAFAIRNPKSDNPKSHFMISLSIAPIRSISIR